MITSGKYQMRFSRNSVTPKNSLFVRELRRWKKGKAKGSRRSRHMVLLQREAGKNLEKCGFGENY